MKQFDAGELLFPSSLQMVGLYKIGKIIHLNLVT